MIGLNSIHTTRQIRWVLDHGLSVSYVGDRNSFPNGDHPRLEFVRRPTTWGARIYSKVLPSVATRYLLDTLLINQYRTIWKRTNPDIVHVNWIDDTAYRLAAAQVRPLILTAWGTDINQHFFANADERSRRRVSVALRAADAIIVDSADMVGKCEELAQKKLRIELIPLGIDTEVFRPLGPEVAIAWRRRLGIPENAKVVVSIRAFEKRYGHEAVLEAFAKALPGLQDDAVLVFKLYYTGAKESFERDLRGRADQLGVSDRIRWIPAVPYSQLPEIYALADLVVNYPAFDAFPVSFIESAACCRRLVSCRLAAYRGTFAEKYFRMIEPENVAALAAALVQELNTPCLKDLLSEARNYVAEHYNENISARKLVGLYEEVAEVSRMTPCPLPPAPCLP